MSEPGNETVADGVLAVFFPGRRRIGALATALRKHGLQYLEDWPTPALRARYAGRDGLCLTLAGFEATPAARGRFTLPEALIAGLNEVSAATSDALELVLLIGVDDAPKHAHLSTDALAHPLVSGCRYVLAPPAPRASSVPGRPEIEGWTRRER